MAEPDLAELEEMRGALVRARAGGKRAVSYSSGGASYEVAYRTDAEMESALADLDRRIAALSGASAVRTVRQSTSKGV